MSFRTHPGAEYRTRCGQFIVNGREVRRVAGKDPVSEWEAKAAQSERDAAMRASARGARKNLR